MARTRPNDRIAINSLQNSANGPEATLLSRLRQIAGTPQSNNLVLIMRVEVGGQFLRTDSIVYDNDIEQFPYFRYEVPITGLKTYDFGEALDVAVPLAVTREVLIARLPTTLAPPETTPQVGDSDRDRPGNGGGNPHG